MAKMIKFDLLIDGTKVKTFEELQDNLHPDLLPYLKSGKLAKWFLSRDMADKAEAIQAIDLNQSDLALMMAVCEVLELEVDEDILEEDDTPPAPTYRMDWSGKDLIGRHFDGEDFSNCNFEGTNFSKSRFFNTNLSGANLKNAILKGTNFYSVNLTDADLSNADCSNAYFSGVDLKRTNLDRAKLPEPLLEQIRLKDASLEQIQNLTIKAKKRL